MHRHTLEEKLILFAATGGGLGLIPVAPGTFGTLAGIPLILLFSLFPSIYFAWMLICLLLISVWISDQAEKIMKIKDPGSIVIDEIAGYCVTMSIVQPDKISLVLGFVLFRLLDIKKPFPVSYFEKNFSGGAGIVLDDLAAGIIAATILKFIQISGLI